MFQTTNIQKQRSEQVLWTESYQNRSGSRNRDNSQIIDPDRITGVTILDGMVDRIIEETIEMRDIMTTIEME